MPHTRFAYGVELESESAPDAFLLKELLTFVSFSQSFHKQMVHLPNISLFKRVHDVRLPTIFYIVQLIIFSFRSMHRVATA
jgi:hypothetical protein